MYKILAKFQTGNSFGSEDTECEVEMEWKSLEVAEANLKRIEQHYKQYQLCNSSRTSHNDKQKIFQFNSRRDWFVKEEKLCVFYETFGKEFFAIDKSEIKKYKDKGKEVGTFYDDFYAIYCIILYTDDNKPFQFSCPWCGYFEHLHSVEIIVENHKITF